MSTAFIRDRIELDETFPHRSGLDQAPPGSALLIAAREIVLTGDVELDGHDLVLLADRLDGSAGTLTVRNPVGAAPGHRVTVACRVFRGLSVTTVGGEGEQGPVGETGAEGRPGRPASLPFKPGFPGGRGGRGGTGGRGLPGGPGGRIAVRYVFDETDDGIDPARCRRSAGRVAPAAKAVRAGREARADLAPRTVRTVRQDRRAAPARSDPVARSASTNWYRAARTSTGRRSGRWPAAGPATGSRWLEYYFRAANPSTPTEAQFLALARAEAEAVLATRSGQRGCRHAAGPDPDQPQPARPAA